MASTPGRQADIRSKRRLLKILAAGLATGVGGIIGFWAWLGGEMLPFRGEIQMVKLSEPRMMSSISVEQALKRRRSRREYTGKPVMLSDVSQLCWAAQGITEPRRGFRTAPSAGGLYPIGLYVVVGDSDIEAGIYRYITSDHTLELVKEGDYREVLYRASLEQDCVRDAALDFIITGVFSRTAAKYGDRGRERYVWMEAGHVAENIYLQAEALDLGTVSIGAFYDDRVREILSIPGEYTPIYVMPIGHI